MEEDELGFSYPTVDFSQCVGCDCCERACPVISTRTVPTDRLPGACIAWTTRGEDLSAATSGGVFTAVARNVLDRGGVVVGAAYGDDLVVRHVAVESLSHLHKLSRSKYVQSDMGNVFEEVEGYLRVGREVLFSGTPCQAYAIQAYCRAMRIDVSRLMVVDVVCHGTPMPKLLREYLAWQGDKHGSPVVNLSMRGRDLPGHYGTGTYIQVDFADGQHYKADTGTDPFGYFFFGGFSARPSCYQCPFKVLNHATDLTLGDCWFSRCITEREDVPFEVTLCFSHTKKGQILLNSNCDLECVDVDVLNAVKCNGGMLYSSGVPNQDRDEFLSELGSGSFESIVARRIPTEGDSSMLQRLVKTVKSSVKALIPERLLALRWLRAQDKEYGRRMHRVIPESAFAIQRIE